MTRYVGGQAQRGSQHWFQIAANQKPDLLNYALHETGIESKNREISWLSPRAEDDFAEYSDETFLSLLDINLEKRSLKSFWPARGPVWDGLAKMNDGQIILIEAKAHLAEIHSPASQAKSESLKLIRKSLNETKKGIGVNSAVDWSGAFYQYANRIAFLYLLRTPNNIPTHLVFLNFVKDHEMNGPASELEWKGALQLLETYLGLPHKHKLSKYIHHAYLDVERLK